MDAMRPDAQKSKAISNISDAKRSERKASLQGTDK